MGGESRARRASDRTSGESAEGQSAIEANRSAADGDENHRYGEVGRGGPSSSGDLGNAGTSGSRSVYSWSAGGRGTARAGHGGSALTGEPMDLCLLGRNQFGARTVANV